jgi:hypothetical protein
MARPLAGGQRFDARYASVRPMDVRYAPQRVGGGQSRVQQQRVAGYATPAYRAQPANTPQRFDLRGTRHMESARHSDTRQLERRSAAAGLQRREETRQASRARLSHQQTQQAIAARQKATVKQRRQNVLFLLVLITALSGLLVAAAHNTASKAALTVSACALVGYVYLLAQMRRSEHGADEYYRYEAA